ncbi:MAG TPA: mycofactocin biosynthesis peptidyl-dipeptidase MftE [Ilumatobacter sp.]|nr:mycofactocin biosynthesis peptidyl-dipeptidase MftE [Ilumatobacter sp.]
MTDALGARAWPDVGAPVVVVPVGSFEQHGPHLPLDTDTRVAAALASVLVAARPVCVLGPTVGVTASGEHHGFPGTLSIGVETTTAVLVELARSADWSAGVVFVNGHGGNAAALRQAADVLAGESRPALCWGPRVPGGDLHAGRTETSLMLHLAPELVRLDLAVAGPRPPLAELVAHGVRALSPSGVLGDPDGATANEGATLFDTLAADLVATVDRWLA